MPQYNQLSTLTLMALCTFLRNFTHVSMKCGLYFTDIGYGWGAASINTEEEYSFTREGQKTFSNSFFLLDEGYY